MSLKDIYRAALASWRAAKVAEMEAYAVACEKRDELHRQMRPEAPDTLSSHVCDQESMALAEAAVKVSEKAEADIVAAAKAARISNRQHCADRRAVDPEA